MDDFLKTITLDEIHKMSKSRCVKAITYLNRMYYTEMVSVVSDQIYDAIRDRLKSIDPDNKLLHQVDDAMPTGGSAAVPLPFYMGSMNKIYPSDKTEFVNWKKRNPSERYIVMHKLDGISVLISRGRAYTRGPNGTMGTDITEQMKYIAKDLLFTQQNIRGELSIAKDLISDIDARTTAGGEIRKKKINPEALSKLSFIAYEFIEPGVIMSKQLRHLADCSEVVWNVTISSTDLTIDNLSTIYNTERNRSKYAIDGLIVIPDVLYLRNTEKNPTYAFAYKENMTDQIAYHVRVLDVEYRVSKDGLLKPRLRIEDTRIGNVTISYVTAYNAKYVTDNRIGIGSEITLIRSGDVIPKILEVTKPSKTGALPSVPYRWNETKVDFVVIEESSDMEIKKITHFFETLEIRNISEKTIELLYKNGIDTLLKFLTIQSTHLQNIPGIGDKKNSLIVQSMKSIVDRDHQLVRLMDASMCFGRGLGSARLRLIVDSVQLALPRIPSRDKFIGIPGVSDKTIDAFLEGCEKFNAFMKVHKKYLKISADITGKLPGSLPSTVPDKEPGKLPSILHNVRIVFTGFRDKELEKKLVALGAIIQSQVTKTTKILIVKSLDDDSTKLKHAKEIGGIEIIELVDFCKKYKTDST